MSEVLFHSWHQWKVCMVSALKNAAWGITKIISGIFLGIISLIVWLWHLACKWVGKHPNIALGGFIVVAVLVWVLTFVSMRSRAMGAEFQRDSIAYQYQKFKEGHGYE